MGELAYQLSGKAGYEVIRPNDENRIAPKGLFKDVLKKTTNALILIDELADYCVAASGVQVGGASLSRPDDIVYSGINGNCRKYE